MASEAQHNPFIRNLASSDKRTRDRALESLRTFLSGRSQIEEIELLKLWKGLFYCMWMQDKPLNQQQLARDLAALVEVLQPDVVLPFLDTFWKTIAREWGGIDALRMDKYLYLIRMYLRISFQYLSKHNWTNQPAISSYTTILEQIPLNPTDMKIPNGLRYHVMDIYVDEMDKVDANREGHMPVETLLNPIKRLEKESPTKAVRKHANETLEDERLSNWNGGGDREAQEKGNLEGEGEDDEWGGIED